MANRNYELRTCLFFKDPLSVSIGKITALIVKPVERIVTWTEKEDAGGGCYWKNGGIKRTGTVTDYFVYDLSNNYIGEIVNHSSCIFSNKDMHHIKVLLTSIQILNQLKTIPTPST